MITMNKLLPVTHEFYPLNHQDMSHHNTSQFTRVKQLGQGAFGTVYLAKDASNAEYALKTIQVDPFAEEHQHH